MVAPLDSSQLLSVWPLPGLHVGGGGVSPGALETRRIGKLEEHTPLQRATEQRSWREERSPKSYTPRISPFPPERTGTWDTSSEPRFYLFSNLSLSLFKIRVTSCTPLVIPGFCEDSGEPGSLGFGWIHQRIRPGAPHTPGKSHSPAWTLHSSISLDAVPLVHGTRSKRCSCCRILELPHHPQQITSDKRRLGLLQGIWTGPLGNASSPIGTHW